MASQWARSLHRAHHAGANGSSVRLEKRSGESVAGQGACEATAKEDLRLVSIFEDPVRRSDERPQRTAMALNRSRAGGHPPEDSTMFMTTIVGMSGSNERGSLRIFRRPPNTNVTGRIAAKGMACAALVCFALIGTVAQAADSYPHMAPVTAYLMERAQEISFAKSAAPASISGDATVLVLTPKGYETAVTGTNGFVCWVARGFSGAPDWPERWNPKIRAAGCDNPQAARSVTPIAKLRTAMTLAGRSDADVADRIKAALRSGEIPPLGAGAMCYMMSKSSYLSDDGGHDMAHVMFYIPSRDGADWGANAAGSPVFGGNYWFYTPDRSADAAKLPPLSVLLVGVATWSDGTPAAMPPM
jgi:hypothetical protein